MVCTLYMKPMSHTQKVAKKHFRLHLKRLRDREYSRLRCMVPSVANKDKVSKVTVIEEAVKYIDHLHQALMDRFQSSALQNSKQVDLVTEEKLKHFVQSMMLRNLMNQKTECPKPYEKQKKHPSFMLKQNHRSLSN